MTFSDLERRIARDPFLWRIS